MSVTMTATIGRAPAEVVDGSADMSARHDIDSAATPVASAGPALLRCGKVTRG
jgi:hypothetical protein